MLLILKIIGILLLVVLGLLVLAVLCLLFVPVRYRIRGKADEHIEVHIRLSWLLHILTFSEDNDGGGFKSKLMLFGIPLKRRKEGEPPRSRKKKKDKNVKGVQTLKRAEEAGSGKEKAKGQEADDKKEAVGKQEVGDKKETVKETDPAAQMEVSRNLFSKIRGFFTRIKKLPGMIKSKWETLKEKGKNLKETSAGILKELRDENNWEALRHVWQELRTILKRLSPRQVKICASFSLGDPASTGQVLGLLSVFPFIYRYQVRLYPDFEAERFYFKGTFHIKGKLHGIHALLLIVHLFKDNKIRGLFERHHNS